MYPGKPALPRAQPRARGGPGGHPVPHIYPVPHLPQAPGLLPHGSRHRRSDYRVRVHPIQDRGHAACLWRDHTGCRECQSVDVQSPHLADHAPRRAANLIRHPRRGGMGAAVRLPDKRTFVCHGGPLLWPGRADFVHATSRWANRREPYP
eukprot:scaffold45693_cov65-Phaeocystis_antarctica.AAC.4